MIAELAQLRDLIADANRNLALVHATTKDILAKGYVDNLVLANKDLLEALRIVRSLAEPAQEAEKGQGK